MKITNKEIAECVGLWLAEGDNKTNYEITFTNNCFDLVILFHGVIKSIYGIKKFRPRLYSYSKNKGNLMVLEGVISRDYIDSRARKPYYIYRLGSVKAISNWKKLVMEYKNSYEYSLDILRGFFAGEGNIKVGERNKIIRIAQKQPVEFVNKILDNLDVHYSFSFQGRSYIIWGRESWDKLAKIQLADLHPDKKNKFWKAYLGFKQYHYSHNFLKEEVYKVLTKPYTAFTLSKTFNRSQARLCDVLMELKEEQKINNFIVISKSYWIRNDQNIVIISSVKQNYLKLLENYNKTSYFAREMQVCWKSAHRRLNELQRLGLVSFENGKWVKLSTEKKIVVLEE